MAKQKQKESRENNAQAAKQPVATTVKTLDPSLTYKLLICLFVLYVIGVVLGVITHESWGDEAQPWLLARDLSIPELLKILPSEGHPPLWYLVLFPFAKLGFPYETVKWISAIAMMAAVFILLFRTNANVVLKFLVPFSYFFFYKYTVFGRSYSMIALFAMLIIALYPKRFERPFLFAMCVVLLFNTHMLAFSFASCLVLLYLIDAIGQKQINSKNIAALAIMGIGGLYLIPYLTGSAMADHFKQEHFDHWHNIRFAIKNGLMVAYDSEGIAMAAFIGLCLLLLGRTKAFLVMLGGIAGVLYIVGFRYSFSQTRHFGVLFIIIVCCYCLAELYKNDNWNIKMIPTGFVKYGCWLVALLGLLQTSVSFNNFKEDFNGMYSCSKDVAEFIRDNHMENSIIVGEPYWAAISVLPYLPPTTKLYNAGCDRFGTYYLYDSCYMKRTNYSGTSCVRAAYEKFHDRMRDIIFLVNFKIDLRQAPFLEMAYEIPEMPVYKSERYFIYRFTNYIITQDSLKNLANKGYPNIK